MIRAWNLLSSASPFSAPPWIQVFRDTLELPSGRIIDDYYRVVLPDFAAVVALTSDRRLVMVRGYKHGLREVTLCVPSGLVEPGEEPLGAARRELLEETGYASNDWQSLGRFVVDGNRQCGTMHLFVARGVAPSATPLEDDAEDLEIALMSFDDVTCAIRAGEVPHLATASAVALAFLSEL